MKIIWQAMQVIHQVTAQVFKHPGELESEIKQRLAGLKYE